MKIEDLDTQFDIICTFENNNKNYIVYFDSEKNIVSSTYEIVGTKLKLNKIETEEEFEMIKKRLEEI